MGKKIAFLFPGQGAQYVGMGKDFYDQFAIARETFQEADDLLSFGLSQLIFNGPSQELTLTKQAQIAIYVVSIAIWRSFQQQFPDIQPVLCAGLSLGEYTALTAAAKISFADCLPLVRSRGQFMNDACEIAPGTMHVVLGLEAEAIEAAIKEINPPHRVWVANLNCPGQVVIAGDMEGVMAASNHLKGRGAKRVLPLEVSGAFHCPLMRSAQEKLAPQIASAELHGSAIEMVMNVPGDFVSSLADMRTHMLHQVTNPVRWEKGVRNMMARGVDIYFELGCGKTLQGMNKKIGVTAPTISIEKVTDLEGVLCNC